MRDKKKTKTKRTTTKKESESLYRLLAENVSDVIWTMDMNMRFTYISPSVTKLIGYTVEEALTLTLEKILTPASLGLAMKVLAEELAIEKMEQKDILRTRTLILEEIHKNSSTIWIEAKMSFLRNSDGEPIGILGVSRDITERKYTEKKLQEREETYRRLVETSPYSVVLADITGKIIFCNQQTLKMHGFKNMEEVLGMSSFDLFAPECRQQAQDAAKQTMTDWGFRNVEYTLIRKDGSKFPAEASASLIADEKGEPHGFIGVLQDITDRKVMENSLLNAKKLESIGVLAGGIAHDYNNLLTALFGNVFLIKMYLSKKNLSPDDEVFKRLKESEEICRRAKELSSMLITFAKGGKPIKEPVMILEMVREQSNLLLGSTNIACELEFPENLYPIKADKMQIKQVIRAVIINAVEAMSGKGLIRISAGNIDIKDDPLLKDGKYLKLSVADNGIGISEENIT